MRRWTIVLIAPQESGNVGAAARVLKNFGAAGLRIVAPRCEILCDASRAFASGASEILRRAEVFETLPEALADRELSIGLTGVGGRHHRMDCVGLIPEKLISGRDGNRRCALVFGREERGMEAEDMEACDFLWSLPAQPDFPSLNLAQAIAVSLAGLAEAERIRGLAALDTGVMPSEKSLNPLAGAAGKDDVPATNEETRILLDRYRELMLRVGWMEGRRVADSLATVRNVLSRAGATRREVNLFHGIARQAMLAINQPELFPSEGEQSDEAPSEK